MRASSTPVVQNGEAVRCADDGAPEGRAHRHDDVLDRGKYLQGNFFYDLAKSAMVRIAEAMAAELRPHGVTSVALSAGFMRRELVLAHMRTDEEHWREHAGLARTETPRNVGRAVAALACDPEVASKTGRILTAGELAREYGITDVDGRQPPPFETNAEG